MNSPHKRARRLTPRSRERAIAGRKQTRTEPLEPHHPFGPGLFFGFGAAGVTIGALTQLRVHGWIERLHGDDLSVLLSRKEAAAIVQAYNEGLARQVVDHPIPP